METTKTSNFTYQSKSSIVIFFTCQVSACEPQRFPCHDLANDIYSQTAKTVFSHLNVRDWTILRCCAVNIKQATRWVSDKAYNIMGPVNSSVVYALSTDISVRESTFDFWFSLFTLKIDFKDRLLILRFDFWWPLSTAEVDVWWAKRKMPWALFAVKKLKLPWGKWNCREQVEIAVSKLKLPWVNWNCREQIEIAVTLLGHRKIDHNSLIQNSLKSFRKLHIMS